MVISTACPQHVMPSDIWERITVCINILASSRARQFLICLKCAKLYGFNHCFYIFSKVQIWIQFMCVQCPSLAGPSKYINSTTNTHQCKTKTQINMYIKNTKLRIQQENRDRTIQDTNYNTINSIKQEHQIIRDYITEPLQLQFEFKMIPLRIQFSSAGKVFHMLIPQFSHLMEGSTSDHVYTVGCSVLLFLYLTFMRAGQ